MNNNTSTAEHNLILEAFERLFRTEGQVVTPSFFEEHTMVLAMAKLSASRVLEGYSDGKTPPTYVALIGSQTFRTQTKLENGTYYIGMNIGTIFTLQALFMRMMCQPDVFPEVGDSSNETPRLLAALKPTGKTFNEYSKILYAADITNAKPKDFDRYNFALSLLFYALDFILWHELGHIAHGHLAFIESVKNKTWDIPVSIEYNVPYSYLQTLEYDADAYATSKMIASQTIDYEEDKLSTSESKEVLITNNLKAISFAIQALFRLNGNANFTMQDFENKSHHPQELRSNTVLSTAATIFLFGANTNRILGRELSNKLIKPLSEALLIVESAFYSISFDFSQDTHTINEEVKKEWDSFFEQKYGAGNRQPLENYIPDIERLRRHNMPAVFERFERSQNGIIYEFGEMVRQNWRTIRPQLMPFAFSNLPDNTINPNDKYYHAQ